MKILAVIAILVTVAFAQQPTYEQTSKWIISKIIDNAGHSIKFPGNPPYVQPFYTNSAFEQVSMDDCSFKFTEVGFNSEMQFSGSVNSRYPSRVTNYLVSIPLQKVSRVKQGGHLLQRDKDQHVVMDEYDLYVFTSVPAISIKKTEKSGDQILSQKLLPATDSYTIAFGRSPANNEDVAIRMEKAITHAVDLCTKSKDKEPF